MTDDPGQIRHRVGEWLGGAAARRILAVAGIALAAQLIFAWRDAAAGLSVAREEPAVLDAWRALQAAVAGSVAWLIVGTHFAIRAKRNALETCGLGRGELWAGAAATAAAALAASLFLASPEAFHLHAQEDRPVEWLSAALTLGASLAFAALALRSFHGAPWSVVTRLGAAGLALLFFVIGMEEISWMQRLFGFATPDGLAEVNWQGEFNLHNVQTDLSEFVYYLGAGLFLILLPLLRDVAPPALAGHPLARLVPGRAVALVSAPSVLFTYGKWNLFAPECLTMLTFCVLVLYARAALRRSDAAEAWLFAIAAATVAAGQLLFLGYGHAMVDVPDSTEYRELLLAAGFACYGWSTVRRFR